MKNYIELIKKTLDTGINMENRTGTNAISTFSEKLDYNLQKGFPLLTSKRTPFKTIAHELLWFISGDTNIKYLTDNNVKIWNEWADSNGEIGKLYGFQWRNWGGKVNSKGMQEFEGNDQLDSLIESLKNNSTSRRLIVSTWNVNQLDEMALAPCHILFQCYSKTLTLEERLGYAVKKYPALNKYENEFKDPWTHKNLTVIKIPKKGLSIQVYQRSCDLFLGVPFNIASYALLTHLIAHCTDHIPLKLHWVGGDCHIYENHIEGANEMINRPILPSPKLNIEKICPKDIDKIRIEHFNIKDYKSWKKIKGKVAV